MKKILFFAIAITFSAVSTLSAQTLPSVKSSDLTKMGTDAVSQVSSDQTNQIKEALMKDKDLQEKTIDHLKSNPDTKDSLMNLASKNSGGLNDLMKSVLGDKSLSQAAVDYISKNPDLLSKAMKIIGM